MHSSKEITSNAIVKNWNSHINMNSKKRSYGYYSARTGIPKSTLWRAHKGELILSSEHAFELFDYIFSSPIKALNFLKDLPCYAKYAEKHLSMIEYRNNQSLANNNLSDIYFDPYNISLIYYLIVPRKRSTISLRKGQEALDKIDDLIEHGFLQEDSENYISLKSLHLPTFELKAKLMKSHLDFFRKNNSNLISSYVSMKTIDSKKIESYKKIFETTEENLSNIPYDENGDSGIMMGMYIGHSEVRVEN